LNAFLFVFINPFTEISFEESVLDFLFGQSGPVLGFQILLAKDEVEGTRIELLAGFLWNV